MRQEWYFQYPAEEVLAAALHKIEHHKQRLEHYCGALVDASLKNAKAVLRPARERPSDTMSVHDLVAHNRAKRLQDMKTLERDQNAKRKTEHHNKRLTDFARWARVLEKKKGQTLELTIGDVEFFGL